MIQIANDESLAQLPAAISVDQRDDALVRRISESLAHPLAESFTRSLEVLAGLVAASPGGRVRVWSDLAPLSFSWMAVAGDGRLIMRGGLIFHGSHDGHGSGGAPTYSTTLDRAEGWRLHT